MYLTLVSFDEIIKRLQRVNLAALYLAYFLNRGLLDFIKKCY